MKLELIETTKTFRATDNNGQQYMIDQNADGTIDVHRLEINEDGAMYWDEVEDEETLTAIVLALSNIQ